MIESLSKEDRDWALKYLGETRRQLRDEISGLSDAQMNFKAAADRWSIAEITEHLVNAENTVLALVTQRIVKTPVTPELAAMVKERVMKSPVPSAGPGTGGLFVKDQVIILMANNRTTRQFQAPEPVAPRGKLTAQADLIAAFDQARGRTIAYLGETTDDLRGHLAEHWVFGVIDAYQWLLFAAAHSERHIAQIAEVKAHTNFPKQ